MGVRGVLGAGREYRYLGHKEYRWHKGALGAPRGVGELGVSGVYWGWQGV